MIHDALAIRAQESGVTYLKRTITKALASKWITTEYTEWNAHKFCFL